MAVPVSYYFMFQWRNKMFANIFSIFPSFHGTVVPYEISKVNFRVETKILVSMSEEIQ
jgi:hypothetical protein